MSANSTKIFGVGLPRTGTTSFGDACELLGFKRLRWTGNIHGDLTIRTHRGDFARLRQTINEYDAFEDMPFCMVYDWLTVNFPDAKFVLTVRKNPEDWLRSLAQHLNQIPNWIGTYLLYGTYQVKGHEQRLTDFYYQHIGHITEVMRSRQCNLLTLEMGDEDNMSRLAEFLDRKFDKAASFPHSNRGSYRADNKTTN
jgi:hypothetical protein